MSKIEISLDYNTLEKIIDMNDPKVSLKIREGVLSTFADKYIKGVNNSIIAENLKSDCIKAYSEYFAQYFGKRVYGRDGYYHWELSEPMKKDLNDYYNNLIQKEIEGKLEQKYGEIIAKYIDSKAEEVLDTLSSAIDKAIDEIVKEEVKRKVQEKLADISKW